MSFGHRCPKTFQEQMQRKKLTVIADQYRDLKSRLADPAAQIDVAFLRRLGAMRAVLQRAGCAA